MKTKRYFTTLLLTIAVSGLCLQTLVEAKDTSQTQSAYSSTVKAAQAPHVARQETMTSNPSLQTALTRVERAEDQMGRLQMSDDQHQKMSAEMSLNDAEDKYIGMLSKMSGVSARDISDMHTAGADWADLPGKLGVHGMSGHKADSHNGNMGSGRMGGHDNGMSGSMGGQKDGGSTSDGHGSGGGNSSDSDHGSGGGMH